MVLVFKEKAAGVQIFAGLQRALGSRDEAGRLRVTILTGIDRDHPNHYRVVIGSNIDRDSLPEGAIVVVSRVNTMTPDTSTNLDRFLNRYGRDGGYLLVPGYVEEGGTTPEFEPQLSILASHLNVRPAWEIGENDPDVTGITEDDNVIIPDGIVDAPILKTIKRIKERREHAPPSKTPGSRVKKVGRNDPCACGSGKKYKKCHGQ
jgi:hypothetical protein